jgi:hypothetical protein
MPRCCICHGASCDSQVSRVGPENRRIKLVVAAAAVQRSQLQLGGRWGQASSGDAAAFGG